MDIRHQWRNLVDAGYYLQQSYCPELDKRYVLGRGNDEDPIAMLIGEAPGAQEAIQGKPFVGKSGVILQDLMAQAGLFTDTKLQFEPNVWLTNVVKFRPPGNRTPTEEEIRAFRRLLKTEWRLIGKPKLIIPIGAVALRAVTGRWVSILRVAGKCQTVERSDGPMHVWPMVHPAYGLRNRALQPVLEQDWKRLGAWRKVNGV